PPVPRLRAVVWSPLPSEPDVPIPEHPALHRTCGGRIVALVYASAFSGGVVALPVPVVAAYGEGIRWPRKRYRVTGTSAGHASLVPSRLVQLRPQHRRLSCF